MKLASMASTQQTRTQHGWRELRHAAERATHPLAGVEIQRRYTTLSWRELRQSEPRTCWRNHRLPAQLFFAQQNPSVRRSVVETDHKARQEAAAALYTL